MSIGPKISFGSEKRVSRYSKYRASMRRARCRTSADLAVPGGPTISMCSPATRVTSNSRTSSALSRYRASSARPTSRSLWPMRSASASSAGATAVGRASPADIFPHDTATGRVTGAIAKSAIDIAATMRGEPAAAACAA